MASSKRPTTVQRQTVGLSLSTNLQQHLAMTPRLRGKVDEEAMRARALLPKRLRKSGKPV
jgi:hypothetical protein